MPTLIQTLLGRMTLPPTPKHASTVPDLLQSVSVWTRQAQLTFQQFERVVTNLDTSQVPQTPSGLYWSQALFDGAFAAKTTDDLAEGITNLYFTTARARASISATAPLLYDAGTGVLSIPQATALVDGFLSAADWTSFDSRVLRAGDTMTGNLILDVGADIRFNVGSDILRADSTVAIRPNSEQLYDSAGISTVDWGQGVGSLRLSNNSGDTTLRWGQRTLHDSTTVAVLNWESLELSGAWTLNGSPLLSVGSTGDLTAGSSKVLIGGTGIGALIGPGASVDIVEANLTLDNLGGTLGATKGGTGQTTVTTGDLLYGSAVNTWSRLADVATGNALISGGVGVAPSWGKIGLTTHVSGILPVANGGSGTSTAFTTGSVIFAGPSGVFAQDNANFFWDDTNNILGIGNNTPNESLEITGNLRFTLGANRTISITDAISGAANNLLLKGAAGVGDSGTGGSINPTLGAAGNRTTSGTAANAGGFNIVGVAGGSSTVSGSVNVGGVGGSFSFAGGVGGAAASGSVITTAGTGGAFIVTAGAGGVITTSGGSSTNGAGGNVTLTSGAGATGVTGVVTGGTAGTLTFAGGTGGAGGLGQTGGAGGALAFNRGAGGGSTQSGAGTNVGGAAGTASFAAAAGGTASGATTANTGGAGGAFNVTGSNGGNGTGGTTATGGAGGSCSFGAGNGGNGTTGTVNVAGTAGLITFTAGNGGSVTSGGTGKDGGSINFTAGNGTNVAGVTNNGGSIYLLPGAKSPSGNDGNVFLLVNSSGTIRGLVGVGTATPTKTLDVSGDIQLKTVGNGVYVKEGTNATMGVATLVAGTVVVSTTKVTANSRIFLTINGGTITNVGAVYISARTAGTSFTITSLNILDTSDVAWWIVEPAA